ncbi:hypothetical protein [Paenibacillus marinisediminis]
MKLKRTVLLLTASAMLMSFSVGGLAPSTAHAASGITNPVYESPNLQSIYITKNSYIQIKDPEMSYTGNDKTVYFTFAIHNGEKSSLDFKDYWVRVTDVLGSNYTPVINPADAKKSKIAPNTTEGIQFSVKVNPKTNLSDLRFKVVKWNFSMPGYEQALGTIAVPAKFSTVVPYGRSKVITQKDLKLKTVASSLQLVKVGQVTEGTMSLAIENISNNNAKLPEMNYYLKSSEGKFYKLDADIAAGTEIAPNEQKNINLYAKLPTQNRGVTYQLYVTSKDGENNTEVPLGYYGTIIKADEHVYTKPGAKKIVHINDVSVATQIVDSMVDTSGDTKNINITLKFENIGKKAVSLPAYQYSIMTSEGIVYPMKADEMKEEILPGMQAQVNMSVGIPSTANKDGLKLLVQKAKEENKKNDYLVAIYQVPAMNEGSSSGNTTTLKNKDGVYEVKVDKLQRLPWEDTDILNAIIEVTNKGTADASVPNIKGYMVLNGNKMDEKSVHLIKPANKLSIKPGETIQMVMSSKVPYNYDYSNVSVVLSNVLSETSSSTIGRFSLTGSKFTYMPYLQNHQPYLIANSGRQSQVNIMNYSVYEGKETDLLYVDFKQTNQETRMNALPRMSAYFIAEDGTYIPAKFEYAKNKISSTGSALVAITANIPKSVSKEKIRLYVGEAITGAEYTTGEAQPDGIVNVKEYILPQQSTTVLTDLKGLSFNPYTLDVNKLSVSVPSNDQFNIEFSYNMKMSTPYEEVANSSHKIVFEIVDGTRTFEKSYTIGGSESESMPTGEDKKHTVTFEGKDVINVLYKGYNINIYDEINGHRKLLGTKEIAAYRSIIPIN